MMMRSTWCSSVWYLRRGGTLPGTLDTPISRRTDRTMQVIPVKETMPRDERSKPVIRTKKGDAESLRVPAHVDPYQRTCICTHGWRKRKTRSGGRRPCQHIRLTDCPFQFVVQWNLEKSMLQVKYGCFVHYLISKDAYETYPSVRGVTNPLVGARAGCWSEALAKIRLSLGARSERHSGGW
jgi:hypothetical protein